MENKMKRSRYALNLQLFAEGDPDTDKTFTQADLDRIVADRLARDRKGREDYDSLKMKLTALEQAEAEREAAKLSDTERLEAEKATALAAAESAKTERDKVLTTANQRIINAEFKSLAREANVPADRVAAALKLADLSAVTVDDEGNAVGVKEAVEALIVAEPYLANTVGSGNRQIGGDTNGGSRKPGTDGLSTREKLSAGYASK
ncbi:phage scaffolding protein [Paenibacillus sp. FSL L8-0708]|uniref:phage scaffolding protein n=1 Tax=Paenibacillus sp. FSL L8-0708 TaxID=2975311 RepID=UPI0030FD15C3